MIVTLLVGIIRDAEDARAERSIVPCARDPLGTTARRCDPNVKAKRSSSRERAADADNAGVIAGLDAELDDPERTGTEALARKMAKEAIESPQLRRGMKKLVVDLSEPRRSDATKGSSPLRRTGKKSPTTERSTRKRNKSPKKGRKGKKGKSGHSERHSGPGLRKRNYVKVSASDFIELPI